MAGGVLLFQEDVSYAIILAGTGNGSFIGLGATLLPLLGFQSLQSPIGCLSSPIARIRPNPKLAAALLLALALPMARLALLIFVSVFRL